jgi:hypothetical protein
MGIVKQAQNQSGGIAQIDCREFFGFKETKVILGKGEAWHLNDIIRPFGQGSKKLARLAGVEFLKPDTILVDGVRRDNPYIQRDKNDKAIRVYIRKAGIVIAADGIRYAQPVTDIIEIRAIVSSMAINAKTKAGTPDAAKYCTRSQFESMIAQASKMGDAAWYFVPTADENTGIAFNLNAKGDAGKVVEKFMKDLDGLYTHPLRKIETATDRRIFESLLPEMVTAVNDKTAKKGSWGAVDYAEFTIEIPTSNPIHRAALIEFGIALRDNDADSRERKFGELTRIIGGNVAMQEVQLPALESGDVTLELIEGEVVADEKSKYILPPRGLNTTSAFKNYFDSESQKLSGEQKAEIIRTLGVNSWDEVKCTKSNAQALKDLMKRFSDDDAGVVTPDKKSDPEKAAESEADKKRAWILNFVKDPENDEDYMKIAAHHGIEADVTIMMIPDEVIDKIYADLNKGVTT